MLTRQTNPSWLALKATRLLATWLAAMAALTAITLAQTGFRPATIVGNGFQRVSGDDYNLFHLYTGKFYDLVGGGVTYRISDCGRFKRGQAVEFQMAGQTLTIRTGKGALFQCAILQATNPLGQAAKEGDLEKIQAILKDNPDLISALDGEGNTPLDWAVIKDRLDVAKLLLANKADVNEPGSDGETALHIAANLGYKDAAEFLIANGANVNAKDVNGRTPLHNLVSNIRSDACPGCEGVGELLLANGADINAKDNKGSTPLHAVKGFDKYWTDFLLRHGARE